MRASVLVDVRVVLDGTPGVSMAMDNASLRDVCKLLNSKSSAFLKRSKSMRARFTWTISLILNRPCMSHADKLSSSLPRANTIASRSVMLVTEHSGLQGCMLMNTCFPSQDQQRKNRTNENGYKRDDRSERQGDVAQEFLVTSCSHKNFGRRCPTACSQ
jgi:hypothetical protein